MKKNVELNFVKADDFEPSHDEFLFFMNLNGDIGYGKYDKEKEAFIFAENSKDVESDFILSSHDVAEALEQSKFKKKKNDRTSVWKTVTRIWEAVKDMEETMEEVGKMIDEIAPNHPPTNFKCADASGAPISIRKPPSGLLPEYLWKEERLKNIKEANSRYMEEGKQIPPTWLDEYAQLYSELKERK